MSRIILLLTLCLPVLHAQTAPAKPKPPVPAPGPSISCSEEETAKGCHSFKQLVEARDKDILDSIVVAKPTYVCFRPKEDAFLIFNLDLPRPSSWETRESGTGQSSKGTQTLTEYRDGVFYAARSGFGEWFRYSVNIPASLFESEAKDGRWKGLTMQIDDSEISVQYPFQNQNGGTTQYSLTIRRSTGRFKESFKSESVPTTTASGTCLIYR